jgi:hypothetical protein
MKKVHKKRPNDEPLPEYDFRAGQRGKYADRFSAGTNIVVLSPDVAKVFPDSDSVNDALRTLIKLAGGRKRGGAKKGA